MIFEGLKLAIIGMLVVFVFLILLVLVVLASSSLLKPITDKEEREAMIKKRKKPLDSVLSDKKIMAVIGAAVAAHRAFTQRQQRSSKYDSK